MRAERKGGQLLAKMEKNKGAAAPTRSPRATTLKELGVSKDQSSRWQALAGVPEEDSDFVMPRSSRVGAILVLLVAPCDW